MKNRKFNKVRLASLMHTSRAAIDRLLDPDNTSVTLATLGKVIGAIGGKLNIDVSFPDNRDNLNSN